MRSYITNRMGEMFNAVNRMNYDTIGADGWEISAHEAPAPDHAPYQGRQYPAEEYERINASLERKFGWWNCRHTVYPIRLGESPPSYTEEQRQRYLDENEAGVTYRGQHFTLYEAKGRKRQLESLISQKKYDILAAEGDPELLRMQQIRLQAMRAEYNAFCRATGQTPEPWRTMVATYGRSQANRDAWAVRKLGRALTGEQRGPDILYQLNYKGVPQELRQSIEQELAVLPQTLRALAESRFDKVVYSPDALGCSFDAKARLLTVCDNREAGSMIHEYGHALEWVLSIYQDKRFLEIRRKGFENLSGSDIIAEYKDFTEPIALAQNPKFISQYQGRVYLDFVSDYDDSESLLSGMLEYFSEGFRCYFMEPGLLQQKDSELYQYIKELAEGGK